MERYNLGINGDIARAENRSRTIDKRGLWAAWRLYDNFMKKHKKKALAEKKGGKRFKKEKKISKVKVLTFIYNSNQ